MNKQDGGPAFPVVGMQQQGTQGFMGVFDNGMTLRDYFAAKAMQGIQANLQGGADGVGVEFVRTLVEEAYQWADAMLQERRK